MPAGSNSPDVVVATAVEVHTPQQSPAQGEATTNARHGERWGTPWLKPRAAGGSIAAAISPPPPAKRDVSRTPCGTPTRERGPLTKEPATKEPAVVPAASPIALDAGVTTPSSEVDHRIGGGSAASCPPRSGGNIRDPPPGVRRPPSPRTRPTHTASPDGIRTVEASQPPCAKSPTDSLGLTEPKSYHPMPPHGLTPIPARPVPAVQARKESRPLALDKDGSQQLEPPKAKPRGPSEPSGTRDPSAPACAPIMQSNTVSVCDLMWRALAAGHHFGKNVKPRPYMNLRDSQHLTTHCQQLRAYRAYEVFLNGIPNQLQDSDMLIGIADTLLHLPETFPAAYLKVYDPIITRCLRLSGALQHFDLAEMLDCPVPQLDKARLSESLVGYGFLTTAQYIADLFSAVSDLPSVINASFPAMLSYADPDYWLGALLLAFESHQKGPWSVRQGCPLFLVFLNLTIKLLTCKSMCRLQPWWPSWLAALIGVPSALLPNM